jgi:hypothetical protein
MGCRERVSGRLSDKIRFPCAAAAAASRKQPFVICPSIHACIHQREQTQHITDHIRQLVTRAIFSRNKNDNNAAKSTRPLIARAPPGQTHACISSLHSSAHHLPDHADRLGTHLILGS